MQYITKLATSPKTWSPLPLKFKVMYLHCRRQRAVSENFSCTQNSVDTPLPRMHSPVRSLWTSVADPDFYPSWISNPGSKNRKKREGSYLFCSHKFHTIVNYFIFEMLKKNTWANFQRIVEHFTQKIVTKLSKIWVSCHFYSFSTQILLLLAFLLMTLCHLLLVSLA